MSAESDESVRALRTELTALDEQLIEVVNRRLELVFELRRVKEERGFDFLDPAREQWLRAHLVGANRGPLSREGLHELVTELLDLTKREVGRERG